MLCSGFCIAALLKEIDTLAEDYLNNVRTMSGEMRKEHLEKIEKLFSKSKEFGDDKVQLAMQTYEMVRTVTGIKLIVTSIGHQVLWSGPRNRCYAVPVTEIDA